MEITIFTPTYNRAHTLVRCYESLIKQTDIDFEWLIIDDGSKDNTEQIVRKWIDQDKIRIKYIKKPNGGKHSAHNTAVDNCTSNYFFILDSDDVADRDCIRILKKYIPRIDSTGRIGGLIGQRRALDSDNIPSTMPRHIEYASGMELYQKYGFQGETYRLYKTAILRQYMFPLIAGEKFIYENVVFDPIDHKYTMLIVHDDLCRGDYLPDGYTVNSSKIKTNNPIGYAVSLASSAKYSILLRKKVNLAILYIIWCRHFNVRAGYLNSEIRLLYIILYIPAVIASVCKKPGFFFKIIGGDDA